ncbi:MAG: nitrous oxide reductase family maturation protein NosD [Phycisphaerales bacterium]
MRGHSFQLVALLIGLCLAGSAHCDSPGTQPLSTDAIKALIDAAEPGDTIVVPAGVYHGHLVVRKAVVLEGNGKVTIDGGGEGTVVQLLRHDITMRGFTVRGSGSGVDREPAAIRGERGVFIIEDNRIEDALYGIDIREAPGSIIRRNIIRGKDMEPGRRGDGIRTWWSHEAIITDNEVRDSRDIVLWYSSDLTIARNRVTGSRYGLHFMYSNDTELIDNMLTNNSVGMYLMYSNNITVRNNTLINNRGASGYGLGLKDCDAITIIDNALMANRVGVYIDNSPSSMDSTGLFGGNVFAYNETGALATPNTHSNVFTSNAFVENEEQVGVHGRGSLHANAFSRGGKGNFWSDYAGFDRNGDGIGDLAYEPRSLFESLVAREPNLRFLIHSPAQQAIEFTARAMPDLRPEPKLTDPHPLATQPVFEFVEISTGGSRSSMLVLALLLVGSAGGLTWLVCRERSVLSAVTQERGRT